MDCPPVAVEGKIVVLRPRFPFHYEKVEQPKTRELIEEVLNQTLGGGGWRIRSLPPDVQSNSATENPITIVKRDPRVQAANNIFSGVVKEAREVR